MNILFIDKQDFQTKMRASLIADMPQHTVQVIDNLDDLKLEFKKGKYHIVIIDFDNVDEGNCIGVRCLDYIDSVDVHQRVITLSASSNYSDPHGCEHCVNNYRRKRLNKPTPLHNLVRLIDGYDTYSCDHYHV